MTDHHYGAILLAVVVVHLIVIAFWVGYRRGYADGRRHSMKGPHAQD